MKGVLLAAGLGTRLKPLTLATSKMLVPVYDKPMILHALNTLVCSGVTQVLVVIGRDNCEGIIKLIGDGSDWGVKASYVVQNERKGTANAVLQAERFVNGDKFVVMAGDNVFQDCFKKELDSFKKSKFNGMLFLKKVSDPSRYGVAEVNGNKILKIVEKPKAPKSNLAITGLYFLDSSVFDYIKKITPSERGEYEITDLFSHLALQNQLSYSIIENYWSDVGTIQSLTEASHYFSTLSKKL
ncbi:UTP--glucose-1-phosphate uridylyltransferase AglF [uncultured archaeon]|nr:UTP--glucose-1-phosphate uridylyltransferase AglF [uncultured archaeon]